MKWNRNKAILLFFIITILLVSLGTKYYASNKANDYSAKALESLSGSWTGASFSLDHVYYTEYLGMEIQKGKLETVDWQAANPGFEAKITSVDEKYIYIKMLQADNYPADWDLKHRDKIQYVYYSKYELRLKHNGTTCIFYRQNDLSKKEKKTLNQLANKKWVAQDNSDLSVSFSYFDIELSDASKKSDDKIIFAGKTYFNPQDSTIDVVPEATIVKGPNPILPGIEKDSIAKLRYDLSEDGKTLTLIYDTHSIKFVEIFT